MTEPVKSPLARLVLFMICLSIAGSVVAGITTFAMALPDQKNLEAPTNALMSCSKSCKIDYSSCISSCKKSSSSNCQSNCQMEYTACKSMC